MSLIDALRGLWRTIRRRRDEREIDEEIQFHLDMKCRELEASGLSPREARLEARRAFGSPLLVRERTHESWCASWLESLWLDTRLALRSLVRAPVLSIVLVGTLALGIGANTAVFGLLRPLLLESPDVADPDSVHFLGTRIGGGAMLSEVRDTTFFAYIFFEALRAQVEAGKAGILDLAAQSSFSNRVYLTRGDSDPLSLEGRLVSDNFFAVLGLAPAVGRLFAAEDGAPGARPVVVIAHAFWQRHFGGSADAVGQTLTLNGHAYSIAGVAPPGFRGTAVGDDTDVFVPLQHQRAVMGDDSWLTNPDVQWLRTFGRLAPGMSREAARLTLEATIYGLVRDETGDDFSDEQAERFSEFPVTLVPLREVFSMLRFEFERPVRLLMGIVSIVLLVVCANVANLLLLQNQARQPELAARLALGASHPRLVRQILTECLVLALLGAVLGLLLSAWVRSVLLAFLMEGRQHVYLDAGTDPSLLGFALLVSVGAVLVFGLAPVLRLRKLQARGIARVVPTARTTSGRFDISSGLIVAEIAASLVLMVAAGLLLTSLRNVSRVDSGFVPQEILVARLDPVGSGLTPAELEPVYRALVDRVGAIPGVRSASLSMFGRFTGASWIAPIEIAAGSTDGERLPEDNRAAIDVVQGDFFRTLGIPLLRGRGLEARDAASSERVAVVSETFVRTFFPESGAGDALGRQLVWDPAQEGGQNRIAIVGIAADVKAHDPRATPMPVVYFPASQHVQYLESLEVRASGDPAALAPQVRAALRATAPALPVVEVLPMTFQMSRVLRNATLIGRLTASFAFLCSLLTGVGLYGLLAYAVSLRTKEIGLRMALGATSAHMARLFVGKGLRWLAMGTGIGLIASFAMSRTIEHFLYGLSGMDPTIVVGAILGLTLVALGAIVLPARRAARCDPMTALRWE